MWHHQNGRPLPVICVWLAAVPAAAAQTWTRTSAPITNWQSVASSADGSRLVAVGEQIDYSTNSGDNWTQASGSPQPYEFWSSVASAADGTKSVVGQLGGTIPRPQEIFLSTN